MTSIQFGIGALVAIDLLLVASVLRHPAQINRRGGKLLGFVALFVLPLLITILGAGVHLEHAKTTEFCVSCHVMEPYGQSLLIDDPTYLPAVHFQNNLTPRETACFSCHTTYTMFGDVEAKLNGLKHVWIYYLGTVPEPIELYQPFENRECLECHGPSRSFTEGDLHVDMLGELRSGEMSCLECHDSIHNIHEAGEQSFWQSPEEGP